MRDGPNSADLLTWYDQNARAMPWRLGPKSIAAGSRPDPYRVWLSEIMLQQTTVAAVKSYFEKFTLLWPTVDKLASAEDATVMGEWAGLGYYARARNLLKCARTIVSEHNGKFPSDYDSLLALPGIGPYTAAAISAIAFDKPATVVDGNVERVMSRIHCMRTPIQNAKVDLKRYASELTPQERPGDYAQAVMDLGATICTPKAPACGICPWMLDCKARVAGIAADLPIKLPKASKPTRRGIAYVAKRDDGAYLLEKRPDSGLLGGMLGWPGTEWSELAPNPAPPLDADWLRLDTNVRHTFTHFHLKLDVCIARVSDRQPNRQLQFTGTNEFQRSNLPTVMRKVFDLASSHFALD